MAPPIPTEKQGSLAKILGNRNQFINGYFESIHMLREGHRGHSHSPSRKMFDPVQVGPWVVRGELSDNTLVLHGFDEENGRHLTKKYPWTRKLAQKIELDYRGWASSKFSAE